MCIAILKTKTGVITDEALKNSFESNSDGAGFAYTIDNQLIIEKGIFHSQTFIERFRVIEQIADDSILIHCRIGTSGLRDANNTHPHIISDKLCLIHNGILDINVPKNSTESDTVLFIKKYLNCLTPADLKNETIQHLISTIIGCYNKFVFLDNEGNYTIINEDEGKWDNGCWYSNTSYKTLSYWGASNNNWWDSQDSTGFYSVTLTKAQKKKIKKSIYSLSFSQIVKLGLNVCVDTDTGALLSESTIYDGFYEGDAMYLDDASMNLYNIYQRKYETALKTLEGTEEVEEAEYSYSY